jgi:flagella basal body P-ring formation protein FlgA
MQTPTPPLPTGCLNVSTLRSALRPVRAVGALLVCTGSVLFAASGWAQTQQPEPNYADFALSWARSAAQASLPDAGVPLRVAVSVENLDSRLKLASCASPQAYLPPGSRLWGKTRVGIRCTDGVSKWNVTIPTTVKVFGKAWVMRSHVNAAGLLSETDALETEVDWAEDPNPVLQNPQQWQGQIATRTLTTGMVLRQGMVKAAWVFQAGANIRVIAKGPGFEISTEGQALSAGAVGQLTKVRMENGRVTDGVVIDARTVKINI